MQPIPNPNKIRLLLVDDHIAVRMGLATAIGGEPDMEVVAEAANGPEAVAACCSFQPDVVVLDLRMPKQSGIDTIRVLKTEAPSIRIVIFSSYSSGEETMNAFKAGANGFVLKEMPLELLLEAVRTVYRGEQYVPTEIARRISSVVVSHLSPREVEVLALMAKGLSNKEVGASLGVAEATVKVHVTNIFTKLGVAGRTNAILAAVKRGIIHIE